MQGTMTSTQLARGLRARQPLSIRTRLLQGDPLGQLLGIAGVHMRQQDLFSAARQASVETEGTVPVVGEGDAKIRKKEGGFFLVLRRGEETLELPFDALGLIVEEEVQRVQAFENAVVEIGPTRDLSDLREVVKERPLSDEEAGRVLDPLINGVAMAQRRIEKELIEGTATPDDFVPESFDYFERFCGPDPGTLNPEEYLVSVLPEYRRALLERDPRQGLEICLLGALRDDLCPAPWLQNMDNDSLWEHLTASRPELDPFSLLAALDLALYRQEDERFRSFAERAVGLLAGEELLGPNGLDSYQLIPALASFVLNSIQLMENGSLRQPFWKRMCAWMQATFLARRLHESRIDLARFSEWVGRHLLPAGAHANFMDLRREPLVEAGTISPFGLRRQVLGRLVTLHHRHQAAGRSVTGTEEIQQALERLRPAAPPSAVLLPGPLDGHLLPRAQGKELPDDLKEQLLSLDEDLWLENLAMLSQRFALPEDLKSSLRDVISREIPHNEESAIEKTLTRLWKSGMIAAAERDAEIAESIAAAMLRVASGVQKEETFVWYMVETLLRAAAAFEEESACADWLEAQLFGLANRLPEGEMSTLLWQHMQELKKVTRLELGIFRRAEAVASAAASGQW